MFHLYKRFILENILLILFALFLGYMLNRLNIMQRDGSIALNKFVLYVSYPAIVLLQTPKISFSLELMIPAIVAWTVMTLSAFLILFLSKIFDFSKEVTGSLMLVAILYLGVAYHSEFGVWSFAYDKLMQISILYL